MQRYISKIAVMLLLVPAVAYADRDSQEYRDCSAKYTAGILAGDSAAFKNHVIECQGKPDQDVMFTYSNNSYKQLDSQSLTCLGDINSHRRDIDLSYTFYKLGAEGGNVNAQISLGVMARDENIARRMDISKELQEEYRQLAATDNAFNFFRVMGLAQTIKTDEGKQDFEQEYKAPMTAYSQNCGAVLEKDLAVLERKVADMLFEGEERASRDVDAWIYVEGTMLEDKIRRVKGGLRQFSRMQ